MKAPIAGPPIADTPKTELSQPCIFARSAGE